MKYIVCGGTKMDFINSILSWLIYICGVIMAFGPFIYVGYCIIYALFHPKPIKNDTTEKHWPDNNKPMPITLNTTNTNTCLHAIERDFPEYNYAEIQGLLLNPLIVEYFRIKYGKQKKFLKTPVEKGIYNGIPKSYANNVSCLKLHQAAVVGYDKTPAKAIVTYQVSMGYVENSKQHEVVFTINHSLTMSNQSATLHAVECPNCGAELKSQHQQVCDYCNRPVIRNTKQFWKFSSIIEEDSNSLMQHQHPIDAKF